MAENSTVRSDYNSEWVIWAWAEVKGVCGIDLKILKKLCSLGNIKETLLSKLQKKVPSLGGFTPPPCMPKRLKVSSYIWGSQCV